MSTWEWDTLKIDTDHYTQSCLSCASKVKRSTGNDPSEQKTESKAMSMLTEDTKELTKECMCSKTGSSQQVMLETKGQSRGRVHSCVCQEQPQPHAQSQAVGASCHTQTTLWSLSKQCLQSLQDYEQHVQIHRSFLKSITT